MVERRENFNNRAEELIIARAELYDEVEKIDRRIIDFNNTFGPNIYEQLKDATDPDSPSYKFINTKIRMSEAAGEMIKRLVRNHVLKFYPDHYSARQLKDIVLNHSILDMQKVEVYHLDPNDQSKSQFPVEDFFWYEEMGPILARIFSLPIY